jgi:tRNA dimethylallyltransferase
MTTLGASPGRGALYAVMGPTGTGKTSLAIGIAERCGGEIVSCDSAAVFRGLDVGTAKPTTIERGRIPHHLIDTIDPTEQWSAAQFAAAADAAIDGIRSRGRIPILCGGTGLWMRALARGIFETEAIDQVIRAEIRSAIEERGAEAMHAELAAVDPVAAARIERTDPQRIGRALEVFRQTGRPISELQAAHGFRERRYDLIGVSIAWPKDALSERLEVRARWMYANGIVEETEALLARGTPRNAPGLSIIGYRDAVRLAVGEISLEEAVEATAIATRQFAKRQRNWFRGEPDILPIDRSEPPERVLEEFEKRRRAL